MNVNQHVWDRLFSFALVALSFAYLGFMHPVDGAEMVGLAGVLAGILGFLNAQSLQMLEKAMSMLPLAGAPAGNSSIGSPSSPGGTTQSTTSSVTQATASPSVSVSEAVPHRAEGTGV